MEDKQNKKYQAGEVAPGGFTIENVLNKDEDTLPFGLFNPDTEGKLTWICGISQEGLITSVFCMDLGDHKEKEVRNLKDIEEAKYYRNELISNGWKKLIPPKIEFTVGKDGKNAPLNRKQRRYLDKKIKNMKKEI